MIPDEKELPTFKDEIWALVRTIPPGKVMSYGQVATVLGRRGHARQVGYALHQLPSNTDIPWQRVVNSKGEISQRSFDRGEEQVQRILLEREGIVFHPTGRIDLKRYQWNGA